MSPRTSPVNVTSWPSPVMPPQAPLRAGEGMRWVSCPSVRVTASGWPCSSICPPSSGSAIRRR